MFTWMMFNKGTFEDKTQIRTKHTMQAKGCISTCIAIERDGCFGPRLRWAIPLLPLRKSQLDWHTAGMQVNRRKPVAFA